MSDTRAVDLLEAFLHAFYQNDFEALDRLYDEVEAYLEQARAALDATKTEDES